MVMLSYAAYAYTTNWVSFGSPYIGLLRPNSELKAIEEKNELPYICNSLCKNETNQAIFFCFMI